MATGDEGRDRQHFKLHFNAVSVNIVIVCRPCLSSESLGLRFEDRLGPTPIALGNPAIPALEARGRTGHVRARSGNLETLTSLLGLRPIGLALRALSPGEREFRFRQPLSCPRQSVKSSHGTARNT